tara:strand:+ start:149 stop:271 length:123 start_codon:yes stop_codon:yes gene_type:complete
VQITFKTIPEIKVAKTVIKKEVREARTPEIMAISLVLLLT